MAGSAVFCFERKHESSCTFLLFLALGLSVWLWPGMGYVSAAQLVQFSVRAVSTAGQAAGAAVMAGDGGVSVLLNRRSSQLELSAPLGGLPELWCGLSVMAGDGGVSVLLNRRSSQLELSAPLGGLPELRYGLSVGGRWLAPRWLQPLACRAALAALLAALALLHRSAAGILAANHRLLQQRLGLPSIATDWLLVGGEVVQALSALPLSRAGGGSRPQWVGGTAVLQAVACALLALPHTSHWPAGEGGGAAGGGARAIVISDGGVNASLCGQPSAVVVEHPCYFTVALLVVLQVARGLGGASLLVHGLVYLDDNVVSEAAPALIGVVLAVQQLGFRLGHALAYLTTGGAEDPINGWWIGWTVLSALLLVCGVLLVMFPARLPAAAVRDAVDHILSEASSRSSPHEGARVHISSKRYVIREPPDTSFCPSLCRVFTNGVAVCKMLAILFAVSAFLNMESFRDKYLESIYHIPLPKDLLQDPWLSRITTSLLEPVVCGLVVVCSGLAVSWRQPSARGLSAWACGALCACAVVSLPQLWLGCHQLSVLGEREAAPAQFRQPCNAACHCPSSADFAPVCGVTTQHTYYSACLAGCTGVGAYTGLLKGCSCAGGGGFARPGSCDYEGCSSRWVLLQGLWVLAAVLRSATYLATLLVLLRCLEPEDKAIGLGSVNTVVGLLALLPVSYGFRVLVGSHCEFWDEEEYSCKLYHSRGLELSVTLFVFVLLLCSSAMDAVVWVLSRRVRIYPDMEAEEEETGRGGAMSDMSADQRQKLLRRRATPLPRRRRDAPQVQLRRRAGDRDTDDDDEEDEEEVEELRAVQSLMARGNGQPGQATTAF